MSFFERKRRKKVQENFDYKLILIIMARYYVGRVGRKKGKKPTVRKANRLGLFTEVTVDDSRPKHAFPTQSCAADTHWKQGNIFFFFYVNPLLTGSCRVETAKIAIVTWRPTERLYVRKRKVGVGGGSVWWAIG